MPKQNPQNLQDNTLFPGQEKCFIRVLIKRPNLEKGVQLRFDLFPDNSNIVNTRALRNPQTHQGEQQSHRVRRRSNQASTHPESFQLSFDLFPDESNNVK